ncbi:hypothetical protein FQA39_LY00355 [Lamprigera yunnana]|nr:hypothetical protein FQA39_LY00355 [Lamprigera yunnana]
MAYAEPYWTNAVDLRSTVERLDEELSAMKFDVSHEAVYGLEKYYRVRECEQLQDKYENGDDGCEEDDKKHVNTAKEEAEEKKNRNYVRVSKLLEINIQNKLIEPHRKKRNVTRRFTAGTASAPGPKGTESEEKRANKEPPGKEEAPTRETGSEETQEHLAEITRNVMREGAKWPPLSATTPSDEGYPEDVDRLAFYRRYVYIMSVVPENSVGIPVEARKGVRIAVDQMKDRYMLTLGAVRELRANVKELNKQLNEEKQKNITT